MKSTYSLIVSAIDERGRVRFRQVELEDGAVPPDADVGLTLRFAEGVKHSYSPGQKIRVTVEG